MPDILFRMTQTISLEHPELGTITGIQKSNKVNQYLGIKYATIPSRFKESVLNVTKTIDATKYGPQPPQAAANTCEGEHRLIGQKLPVHPVVNTSSESDSLTLNVSVPSGNGGSQEYKNLPVMVYIHGGSFQLGASSWPHYDLAHIVESSERLGKPIIAVSVNYRLGALGFLTSTQMSSAGYAGNYGLKDLVIAFRWVKRYISAFGGDPENVTAIGESAGGVAVTTLLWQEEDLFSKIISMGGTCCMIQPAPIEVHDIYFDKAMDLLDIAGKPFEEQLQILETIPVDELLAKTGHVLPAIPAVDGDLIPKFHGIMAISDPDDYTIPGKSWCKSMMIGDCKDDGHILGLGILMNGQTEAVPVTFPPHFAKAFTSDPEDLQLVNKHYPITSSTPPKEAFEILMQMTSDIGFFAPTHLTAAGFPGEIYVYHFNYSNPWEGIWKGKASHILDVALLFGNYNENGLDETGVETSQEMQEAVISFLHGEQPWDMFETVGSGPMKIFGKGKGKIARTLEEAERYPDMFELIEKVGWAKWWTALSSYLS